MQKCIIDVQLKNGVTFDSNSDQTFNGNEFNNMRKNVCKVNFFSLSITLNNQMSFVMLYKTISLTLDLVHLFTRDDFLVRGKWDEVQVWLEAMTSNSLDMDSCQEGFKTAC